jgi:hypothetical protein
MGPKTQAQTRSASSLGTSSSSPSSASTGAKGTAETARGSGSPQTGTTTKTTTKSSTQTHRRTVQRSVVGSGSSSQTASPDATVHGSTTTQDAKPGGRRKWVRWVVLLGFLGLLGAGIGCMVVAGNQTNEYKQKKSGNDGTVVRVLGAVMIVVGFIGSFVSIGYVVHVTFGKES